MAFTDSETRGVPSDKRINSRYQSLLNHTKDTMKSAGEDVKEIAHDRPPTNGLGDGGLSESGLMSLRQILEAMDVIQDSLEQQSPENDIGNDMVSDEPTASVDDKDLLEELNKIFTPVLVMQRFEQNVSDQANAELSEAAVLTERNMITFDEPARMAQLIATCALLLAKKKNTEKWQLFTKAAAIKKQSKLDIQKEEYADAQALAQKYLVMVSTTNNSSVARDAANDLLPQTQH